MFSQAKTTHTALRLFRVPCPLGRLHRAFKGLAMSDNNIVRKVKGGRPRLDDPKSEPIGFRTTPDEYDKIKNLAKTYGVTIGEFCRLKALAARMPKTPVPAINVKKYQELARLNANLNQLMKSINEGKTVNVEHDFIKNLYDEVINLRKDLMGI